MLPGIRHAMLPNDPLSLAGRYPNEIRYLQFRCNFTAAAVAPELLTAAWRVTVQVHLYGQAAGRRQRVP